MPPPTRPEYEQFLTSLGIDPNDPTIRADVDAQFSAVPDPTRGRGATPPLTTTPEGRTPAIAGGVNFQEFSNKLIGGLGKQGTGAGITPEDILALSSIDKLKEGIHYYWTVDEEVVDTLGRKSIITKTVVSKEPPPGGTLELTPAGQNYFTGVGAQITQQFVFRDY